MLAVPKDVLFIMCSFLLPRDLVRVRTVSKDFSENLHEYFKRTFKTTFLFDLICPMCGNDWINNQPITDYLDIDEDMHYFEVIERNAYVPGLFRNTRRDHLLCEECEDVLIESPTLSHFKLPCKYQIYIDLEEYPWTVLLLEKGGEVIWNQYNCITHTSEVIYSDDENFYN